MPSTPSTVTSPCAPPAYSTAAPAPKYTPNEELSNASADSKYQYGFNVTPNLSYDDEKLKLTRTASDSSLDSGYSSLDSKKDYVGESQGRYGFDGGAPIKDITPNQRTSKRSLISKIKSLVKSPNASTEKPKTSRYMYVPSPPLYIPRTSNLRIVFSL
ncbi:hypothetical protein QFC20_006400 [Naganishia adeliensis]|uniref:Uncharacterized protein n=1 Tax=Naganishia adeliensis TaxID=92952 RepID=A0ACC2VDA3_9TREE|nr:hypothetical protein QFC20_006400 [Naganishia adeliensis]